MMFQRGNAELIPFHQIIVQLPPLFLVRDWDTVLLLKSHTHLPCMRLHAERSKIRTVYDEHSGRERCRYSLRPRYNSYAYLFSRWFFKIITYFYYKSICILNYFHLLLYIFCGIIVFATYKGTQHEYWNITTADLLCCYIAIYSWCYWWSGLYDSTSPKEVSVYW